jgi:uncharacterized coiled-coil protein SlyX
VEGTIQNLISVLEQQEQDMKKAQSEIEETRKKLEDARKKMAETRRCDRCVHWNQHYRVEQRKGFVSVAKIYSGHCMPVGGRIRNRKPEQCCEHFVEKEKTAIERAGVLHCSVISAMNFEK